MATVLQRVKHGQPSELEEIESRLAFEIITENSTEMNAKQLKRCLHALGFSATKQEAEALVYEFDYNNTKTINLADFQKIYLFKALQREKPKLFDQAFEFVASLDPGHTETIEMNALNHVQSLRRCTKWTSSRTEEDDIDIQALARHVALQFYDDATESLIGNEIQALAIFDHTQETSPRISRNALAAFLRI